MLCAMLSHCSSFIFSNIVIQYILIIHNTYNNTILQFYSQYTPIKPTHATPPAVAIEV